MDRYTKEINHLQDKIDKATTELNANFDNKKKLATDIKNLEIQNKLLINTKEYVDRFTTHDKLSIITISITTFLVGLFFIKSVMSLITLLIVSCAVAIVYYMVTYKTRNKISKLDIKNIIEEIDNNETMILRLKNEYEMIENKETNKDIQDFIKTKNNLVIKVSEYIKLFVNEKSVLVTKLNNKG